MRDKIEISRVNHLRKERHLSIIIGSSYDIYINGKFWGGYESKEHAEMASVYLAKKRPMLAKLHRMTFGTTHRQWATETPSILKEVDEKIRLAEI